MADSSGDDELGVPGRAIDEVAYKLEDWDDEAFVDVEEALRTQGVSFRREGFDTLVVSPGDEAVVDRVLDEVEAARGIAAPRAAAAEGDADGETDTRWCPSCGAEYLSDTETCPDCDVELVETPPPSEDSRNHDELIYELVDWSPEMRNQLTLVLEREAIAHEWEGHDLVVAAAVEAQVDSLIDQVEQGDELPAAPADDVDDEADYNVLSDLFVAADRLAGNASDLALCGDLIDAAGPARTMPPPFGVDDVAWNRVLAHASAVVEAIESEADDDVVGERARSLSELLRGYV